MKAGNALVVLALVLALAASAPAAAQSVAAAGAEPLQPQAPSLKLTIPAAAFLPAHEIFTFENHGRYLRHLTGSLELGKGWYLASVNLPHGATVTGFRFYYRDLAPGKEAIAELWRTLGPQYQTMMATVQSQDTWTPGFDSGFDATIDEPVMDNQVYTYYVRWRLSEGGEVWGCAVTIEYTLPAPAPPTGHLSLSMAPFTPFEDGYNYEQRGWFLRHLAGPAGGTDPSRGVYLAPLHLPDGATVTKLTYFWSFENTTQSGIARLQRTRLGFDTYEDMAVAYSSTGFGSFTGSSTDNTITTPIIDNSQYAYYAVLDLPATTDVLSYAFIVDYTPAAAAKPVVSVPAAAFHPFYDTYDYANHGRHLIHGAGSGLQDGVYLAPLHLPHGARITRVTFNYLKDTNRQGTAILQRTRLNQGNYEDLATVTTGLGGPATTSGSSDAILGAKVDNGQYAYWAVWVLPPGVLVGANVQGHALRVEYAFDQYLVLMPLLSSPPARR